MRDIRADLRERLGSIEQDRVRLKTQTQRQLEELEQMEAGVKALLQQEERRFVSANGNGHHAADGGTTPLSRFILAYLRSTNGPVSMDDIKASAIASKYDFGEKAPGRVIHWGLVGMQQGGIVEKKGGKWHLKEVTQ